MNTAYRLAKAQDISDIYKVETACFSRPWSFVSLYADLTTNESARYIVAEDDDKIIGYCSMHTVMDEGHIMNVAVLPSHRRNGVGEGLLQTLFALAGHKSYTLEVRMSNFGAVCLYERLGFVILGRRPKYYGEEDALIMWKGKRAP